MCASKRRRRALSASFGRNKALALRRQGREPATSLTEPGLGAKVDAQRETPETLPTRFACVLACLLLLRVESGLGRVIQAEQRRHRKTPRLKSGGGNGPAASLTRSTPLPSFRRSGSGVRIWAQERAAQEWPCSARLRDSLLLSSSLRLWPFPDPYVRTPPNPVQPAHRLERAERRLTFVLQHVCMAVSVPS